ncbi:MAG: ATP-binding cassette domain-containing protein [Phycisphaerales bacterium]|jgi:ABC-2 type transport system ATP-binding protein|nr:ATP-binding cassette domain-containing protein [Phycisphaerales bacterium]
MTFAIELNQLSKSYGDVNAVQNLHLEIPYGTLCGFLGPNGAGKSTTIRMIMSIIHGDSGTVRVLGTTAINAKDQIGYLPEERGVYRKMKVGAFIEYIAHLKGMRGSSLKTKIEEWLNRIELPDVKNKKCEELSKGMQQKIQFLAAIIHEPELIILDEPFSGLDPVNAKIIGKIIDELHHEGRTILFSTHVLHQAEKICDRIVMIDEGTKVLDGSISSIREQFDPRVIQVEPTDSSPDFSGIDGISQIDNIDKSSSVNLRVEENTNPTDVIQRVVARIPVRGIKLVKPTLDEIFIEQVASRRGNEAATATREELTHA